VIEIIEVLHMPIKIQRLEDKDADETSRIANEGMREYADLFSQKEQRENEQKFSPEKYRRAFHNPCGFFIGAFDGEELVGFVGGGFMPDPKAAGAYMSEVFVDSNYKGRGIARLLVITLEEHLFAKKDYIFGEALPGIIEFHRSGGYIINKPEHPDKRFVFITKWKSEEITGNFYSRTQ
jgi:ribosomal protein S18 acetylase RimI-like enzyme